MATKIDKHELEEPDQLQRFFIALRQWADVHRRRILAGSGAVLAVLLLVCGWLLYDRHYEGSAQKKLYQVVDAKMKATPGSAEGDQAAIAGFKAVLSQYPRSHAGLLAQYKLANLHAGRKEYDLAIPAYEAFLAKAKADSDLTPLAHAGLGACFEAQKSLDKALAQFELALKTNQNLSLEGLHLSSIGRIHEQMNQTAKAVEYYKQALDKTKDPMMGLYLKRKLALLG